MLRFELLDGRHDTGRFDSGAPDLNDWLARRALSNQKLGASRTMLLLDEAGTIAGFYCLSASTVSLVDAPGPLRRNMPDPVPVVLLGRLAVDRSCQGRGRGAALLQHAIERTCRAAALVAARALVVEARDEQAFAFYRHNGFKPMVKERALYLPLKDIAPWLSG